MKEILYTLGKNKLGEVVTISQADKNEQYNCPGCSGELIVRRGQIKQEHFAHKALTPNCTPEGVLHYEFKMRLAERIRSHLESRSPLPMRWECVACYGIHKVDLIKNTADVAVEMGVAGFRPDLTLVDKDGNPIAVIEVVVTHSPEDNALEAYKRLKLPVIQFILEDQTFPFDLLGDDCITATKLNVCKNPKCKRCGERLRRWKFQMFKVQCHRCQADMLIARKHDAQGYIEWIKMRDLPFLRSRGCFCRSARIYKHRGFWKAPYCKSCDSTMGISDYSFVVNDYAYELKSYWLDDYLYCVCEVGYGS